MATPKVRKAAAIAATEVVARGFVDSIEYVLDRTAYVIAKHTVESERTKENT